MSMVINHSEKLLRIFVTLVVIVVPIFLLCFGIYGSFLFSFSIPLFWQVAIRGKSIDTLGLNSKSLLASIIIGAVSGIIIGFAGGEILKLCGLTGFSFGASHCLTFSFGQFSVDFPLAKELGYRLLFKSNSIVGGLRYLGFNIFAIGLGEEILWRGFIQRKIAIRVSKVTSIWITALLFGLIHFYVFTFMPFNMAVAFIFLIAIGGAIWGYLFERFDNIWVAAISHGFVAAIIWKYYFFAALIK